MDLYALPPEQFTAARDGAVREAGRAGEKASAVALAALRRPTVPAYAVNALVRAEPELVEQLLGLGAQLAAAQGAGEGDALRELGAQRRRLVEAVADRAEAAAGRHLAAAARAEVVGTLEAALADPASAEAVRSGRLVRPLSYAGLGAVDLAGAVAAAGDAPAPDAREQQAQQAQQARRTRRAEADRAALEAAGALDDAVRAAERAAQERADADDAVARAEGRVAAAEEELAGARAERKEAGARQRRAGRGLERAHAAVATSQTAAERARAAVARLEGS